MKRPVLFLLLLVLAGGCVHPGIKPRAGAIESGRRIVIVPIEPPPLALPPFLSSAGLFRDAQSLSWVEGPVSGTGRGLAVVSGILLFAELPEATRKAAKRSRSLEEMLSRERLWCPTAVLAQSASELLAASSVREVVIVTNYQRLVAVQNRAMTWHMENWYIPISDWYNQKTSSFTYAMPESGRGEYVLEVGLSNYELSGGHLFIHVMVKLLDPSDGKVLGRARKFALPSSGKIENLFAEAKFNASRIGVFMRCCP